MWLVAFLHLDKDLESQLRIPFWDYDFSPIPRDPRIVHKAKETCKAFARDCVRKELQ
jgi:hypothetical protein